MGKPKLGGRVVSRSATVKLGIVLAVILMVLVSIMARVSHQHGALSSPGPVQETAGRAVLERSAGVVSPEQGGTARWAAGQEVGAVVPPGNPGSLPAVSAGQEAVPVVVPGQEAVVPAVTSSQEAVQAVVPDHEAVPAVIPGQEAVPAVVPDQEAVPAVVPDQEAQPAVIPGQEAVPAVVPNQEAQPAVMPVQEAVPAVTRGQETVPAVVPEQESAVVPADGSSAVPPPLPELAGLPPPLDFMGPMPAGAVPRDDHVALCACVRLQTAVEHPDLREWVLHHVYYFGMKMYIYDHESTPPLAGVLADYVESGAVEVIDFKWPRVTEPVSPQKKAYLSCIENAKGKHEWVAIFDWDEFLWQSEYWKAQPLRNFMQQFEDEGGLIVNWHRFCSNGHVTRPVGLRRSYTSCARNKGGFKSIVRPNVTVWGHNLHLFNHTHGLHTVDERHVVVKNLWPRASAANISLSHYFCKSREDFAAKIKRGAGSGWGKFWSHFETENKQCHQNCTFLAKLIV